MNTHSEKISHGSFWVQEGNKFHNRLPSSDLQKDDVHDCTLSDYGIVRNAHVKFQIEALNKSENFHAAVLFRKNGAKYLGAGLGGWNSYYSIFNRTLEGFVRWPIGSRENILQGEKYEFELELQGGFLSLRMNGEKILPFENFSIRDSLASTMRAGHIGLYAYGKTKSRITLKVDTKPVRCFIITNIDGKSGEETNKRRRIFETILRKGGITKIEFLDSRDLTREHPLMVRIRSAIIEADLVIADLGLGKPRLNVSYELGIAHSVGVPTVHVGPKESDFHDVKYVPSDLRAQFFILEEDLPSKLLSTVKAILDKHAGNFEYLG